MPQCGPVEAERHVRRAGWTLLGMLREPRDRLESAYRFLAQNERFRERDPTFCRWPYWVYEQARLPDEERNVHARTQASAYRFEGRWLDPVLVRWDWAELQRITGLVIHRKNASRPMALEWTDRLEAAVRAAWAEDFDLWEGRREPR